MTPHKEDLEKALELLPANVFCEDLNIPLLRHNIAQALTDLRASLTPKPRKEDGEVAREIVEVSFQSRAKTTLMELLIMRFTQALADKESSTRKDAYKEGLEDAICTVEMGYPRGHLLTCDDPFHGCTCGFNKSKTLAKSIRSLIEREGG